jgi:aarF domain-containing kinase
LSSTTTKQLKSTPPQQKPTNIWYPVLGGLFMTIVGGIKYVHDHVGGTEGLVRSISFYSYAIPKYFLYRFHMINQSPDEVWEELDKQAAAEGLQKAYELEGFYIKGGQMVAANMGGAFPQIWQDTMSVLQDQVPPQDFSVIRQIVKEELPDAQNIFATFESKPIGSAAIGQVHRATLKRDGTPVVVKVRYPNVERILRGDVRTIKMFAQLAQPVHVPALEEIEKQFMTEFDYVQEAEQLNQVKANLSKAGLEGPGKMCRVPKPYMEFCTTRVLVMEELYGVKLADGLKQEMKERAKVEGKTVKQYMTEVKQKETEAKEKGEELKGPTNNEYEMYIGILDSKRKLTNAMHRAYNWTVGLLPGKQKKIIQNKSNLPINHAVRNYLYCVCVVCMFCFAFCLSLHGVKFKAVIILALLTFFADSY